MTATLSTRLVIPHLGHGEREIEVDYTYNTRDGDLRIDCVVTRLHGAEVPIGHLLSAEHAARLKRECAADYRERMEQVVSRGD